MSPTPAVNTATQGPAASTMHAAWPCKGMSVIPGTSQPRTSKTLIISNSIKFLQPPLPPSSHRSPSTHLCGFIFRCTFVQMDQYCKEDVNRVNYLALFYCHNKVAMIFAGLAWMVLLFLIMTITAEVFLCPAIEASRPTISFLMPLFTKISFINPSILHK